MDKTSHNFLNDLSESNRLSDSEEIKKLYEIKLKSKIIKRIKIEDRKQQKKGYDIILELDDGKILTIEEKFRKTFYPDILLEIRHTNGANKIGWLYLSEAEILAYFQLIKKDYSLTLWKLKDLAYWSKTKNFFELVNEEKIKEHWSSSHKNNNSWRTMNYSVPFYILKDKKFEYRHKEYEKIKNILPLDFYDKDKKYPNCQRENNKK